VACRREPKDSCSREKRLDAFIQRFFSCLALCTTLSPSSSPSPSSYSNPPLCCCGRSYPNRNILLFFLLYLLAGESCSMVGFSPGLILESEGRTSWGLSVENVLVKVAFSVCLERELTVTSVEVVFLISVLANLTRLNVLAGKGELALGQTHAA
jgi:hypothetical protein